MSNGSSESKQQPATARRLRDARRRGQVAKSTELSGALSLLCTLLSVIGIAPWASKRLADFSLAVDRSMEALTLAGVQAMVVEALWLMAVLSVIPLAIAAVVYTLTLWLQTGAVFSVELIKPQLERLNPVVGAKRLFSVRSLVQFALMIVKALIIATAAILVFAHVLGDSIRVIYADAGAALTVANAALLSLLLWCGGLFAMLGLLDLVFQRWQFLRELRMSHSEVRREQRDDQGHAEVKSQRKSFAKEPTPRDQLAYIHMASIVLYDSIGRAIALIYRPKQYKLPLCIVRGASELATEMRQLAQQNKVLCVNDSELVAALYPAAHTGMSIPAKHLDAVLAHLRNQSAAPSGED